MRSVAGRSLPLQWEVLSRWPDGSIRWALLDFLASVEDGESPEFSLVALDIPQDLTSGSRIDLQTSPAEIQVDTGAAIFSVSRELGIRGAVHGSPTAPPVSISVALTWPDGMASAPRISKVGVETNGPVRASFRARGTLPARRRRRGLEWEARASFFAGTGLVRIELTVRNPAAAKHRGGCWDLGDPGSVLFRDLSVRARVPEAGPATVTWMPEATNPAMPRDGRAVEIYQDSSGGENWSSRNHVNRHGQVPHAFRGYQVRWEDGAGAGEAAGLRASPVVTLATAGLRLTATIEQLWQNFPKAVEAADDALVLRLFPEQFGDLFELLGGEQKTHRIWLQLEPSSAPLEPRPLRWVHAPLVLGLDPGSYVATGVVPNLTSRDENPSDEYDALIREGLEGPTSFFAKREVIDEYGWRHFGDVYADHESAYFTGSPPVVSHYNNQYDLVYGFLIAFVRCGQPRWFELARDLARHVMDIDVYRTREDKPGYSGGVFWHTDHYQDAHRAGHRSYSKDSPRARQGRAYGGGPSNEHNYTSGLCLYHYLTGCPMARETVLSLAQWVIDMDDGTKTPFGVIDPGPTGLASATRSGDYHGPGRGAGNSINALLDAFSLTGDRSYLVKAEELIARCIHPQDDIAERGLENIEARWSYLVFLQVLGKYLDLKSELGEPDGPWVYARESLLAYARWMRDHEVPYMRVLDRVEYPTETWPAHDLRKSVVFGYAAKYADAEMRECFLEASEAYFDESMAGLSSFETRTYARPLAILLQNGWMRAAWTRSRDPREPAEGQACDFGEPVRFERQLARVGRLTRSPHGLLLIARRLARPDRLARFTCLLAGELRRRWA